MIEKELEWDEFKDRIDNYLTEKGKEKIWKTSISLGFEEAVREVEEERGRPVYFGEVLYDLNEKTGAGGKLGEGIRHELRKAEKQAKPTRVWSVSAKAVVDASNPKITLDQLLSEVHENIDERIEEMKKWPVRQKVGSLFQPNEPFLYCCLENVKGTVFDNMVGKKSEKNVARQFAKWVAQQDEPKTSYLTLREIV